MKLYYSPGACSLAPHIVLKESGLSFEAIAAPTKNHKLLDGPDYYSINPLGYVPFLVLDDGRTLHEVPAISQYIAARYQTSDWPRPTAPGSATSCRSGSTPSAPSCTKAFHPCSRPACRQRPRKSPGHV